MFWSRLSNASDVTKAVNKARQQQVLQKVVAFLIGRAFNLEGEASVFLDRDRLSQTRDRAEQALGLDKGVGDSVQVAQTQIPPANIAIEQGRQFKQPTMATGVSQSVAPLARAASGRQRLERLKEDASRKDFFLIARKVREELDR